MAMAVAFCSAPTVRPQPFAAAVASSSPRSCRIAVTGASRKRLQCRASASSLENAEENLSAEGITLPVDATEAAPAAAAATAAGAAAAVAAAAAGAAVAAANPLASSSGKLSKKAKLAIRSANKQILSLRFLWMDKNVGIALDQVIPGHGTIPLSPFYFWPKKDAWEELKAKLESKPWISRRRTIILLNQATDIINLWQQKASSV